MIIKDKLFGTFYIDVLDDQYILKKKGKKDNEEIYGHYTDLGNCVFHIIRLRNVKEITETTLKGYVNLYRDTYNKIIKDLKY